MELARLKSEKEIYDDAVYFAYRAMQCGADRDECISFIALQLALSENFYDALRLLYRYYPDADKRPVSVMHIIRDCMYGIHEYMHAHHIEDEIKTRGERLSTPEISDSIESFLSQFDLVLNDTLAFGCDCSSMTELWCDVRPIMCIAAVHSAFYTLADGRYSQSLHLMEAALKHSFQTEDFSLAEEYLTDHSGLMMSSAVLAGDVDAFGMCIEGLEDLGEHMPRTLSCVASYALFAKLTSREGPDFSEMPDNPDSSREELLSIVYTLILADEKENAYRQIQRLYPYAEYNIGINRIYAYLAADQGDIISALDAYERIHKLIPWDSSEDFYRTLVMHSKNADHSDKPVLPLSSEDREAAGEAEMELLSSVFNNPLDKTEVLLTGEVSDRLCSVFPALQQQIQLQIVRLLTASQSQNIIDFLRRILLDPGSDDETKSVILKSFSKVPGTNSVAVCTNGNFCEACPRMHTDLPMPEAYYDQYKKCYNTAVRTYGNICALAVNYYYEYFSKFCFSDPNFYEETDMSESFSAIILSMAVHMCGSSDSMDDILDKIYTSLTIDDIEEAMDFIDSNERGYLYDLYGDM